MKKRKQIIKGYWKLVSYSELLLDVWTVRDQGQFTGTIIISSNGLFTGTTVDQYGEAKIHGQITSQKCIFTKRYKRRFGRLINKRAYPGGIIYKFDRENEVDKWQGRFLMPGIKPYNTEAGFVLS